MDKYSPFFLLSVASACRNWEEGEFKPFSLLSVASARRKWEVGVS